jgi:hypothetical protein
MPDTGAGMLQPRNIGHAHQARSRAIEIHVAGLRESTAYSEFAERSAAAEHRITPNALSRSEKGSRQVRADEVAALASTLGVDITRLVRVDP